MHGMTVKNTLYAVHMAVFTVSDMNFRYWCYSIILNICMFTENLHSSYTVDLLL